MSSFQPPFVALHALMRSSSSPLRLLQPLFPEHTHHQRQSAAVTRSRTVTNDTRSQSNTYHRAGNTQAWKWLAWNGNVSHSVGARSWSEILAVGEMADDKRIPVWAGIVEVQVPLHFFLHGGRYKDPFLTLRKVHTSPLYFLFFRLQFCLFYILNIFACRLCFNNYWHHLWSWNDLSSEKLKLKSPENQTTGPQKPDC